jgi:hypothetical protein
VDDPVALADVPLTLLAGDCRQRLAELGAASCHAALTDPPYELHRSRGKGMQGLAWDGSGVSFDSTTWAAIARVLKPGAFCLAFGHPRTFNRVIAAMEDVGERGATRKGALRGGDTKSRGVYGDGLNGNFVKEALPLGRWPTDVAFAHDPACAAQACAPGCAVAALCAQHPEAAAYFPSFFYAQKTPRSERDAGLGHNPHPTPKPLDLGRWLTRLIARPGQTVVDPFMGTGGLCAAVSLSTGEALWWSFIGANALLLPIAALMWAAKGYIEALGGDGPQGPWGFR